MSRIALPVIRDNFQLTAETTAWLVTIFTLPFMVLMPVYGRLSDGLGKRRLLLAGIIIFTLGTITTIVADNLQMLMLGRALQGIGTAGIMPLSMAFISTIFPAGERGKALGTWSMVGPTLAFFGPLSAGFLIESWGWQAAFAPPLVIGVLAFVVVLRRVPSGLSAVRPDFLRTFDWIGVVLLTATSTCTLFFLSSAAITGVPPLRDWRLLALSILLALGFVRWETRQPDPFVAFGLFRNRLFSLASLCASTRMAALTAFSFTGPLYLTDVHHLSPAYVGMISMVSPGVMALIVRHGGLLADRWGSRWPAATGLFLQGLVLMIFSRFSVNTSLWTITAALMINGIGAGLILAALHRAALGTISESDMGMAAGLYSMIRFAGSAIGTAIGGVVLQIYLDRSPQVIDAYRAVFMFFALFSILGVVMALNLREPTPTASSQPSE